MQRPFGLLILALLLLLPAAAEGSTFVALDEEELAAASAAVVRGRVVSVDSFWNPSHTLIVTEATVEVEKALLGEAPPYIIVRTAGGVVEDYRVVAHGFPTFSESERVLLFISRDDVRPLGLVEPRGDQPSFRVTGFAQGHFRILTNRFGQDVVVPTLDADIELVRRDGRSIRRPTAQTLETFEARLQRLGRTLQQAP